MRIFLSTLLGAGMLFIAISAAGNLDVDSWQKFVSKEGRFSVMMPGRPSLSLKRDETPVGEVLSRIYTYENTVISLTAEYSDLPGLAVIFGGRDRIYEESRNAFLEDAEGTQLSRKDIRLDAYQGCEITYENATQRGKAWFILIGKRLYVLQAAINKEVVDRSAIDRYLASFKPMYRHHRGHPHARLVRRPR